MSKEPDLFSNAIKNLYEIINGVKAEKEKQDKLKNKNDNKNLISILEQMQEMISETIKDPKMKDTPDLKLRRYENIKSFSIGFVSCAIYSSLPKFWKLTIPISLVLGRNYIQPIYHTLTSFFNKEK